MGVGIQLPALQIQCVLLHEHEEGEEYCCFSWFRSKRSYGGRRADISVKYGVVRTITMNISSVRDFFHAKATEF